MNSRKKQSGFTLIELMITVAVIAILAAIAVPNYQKYVIRGNRAAGQAAMMDISNLEQQYFLANRAYTDSLSTLSYTAPSAVSSKYTVSVTLDAYLDSSCTVAAGTGTPPSFVIRLSPPSTSSQNSDGPIYISNTGTKCPTNKW